MTDAKNSGRGRVLDAALMFVGGSTVAVTMAACYGAPPQDYEPLQAPDPTPCQNHEQGDYAQPPPGEASDDPCRPSQPATMATGDPNSPSGAPPSP